MKTKIISFLLTLTIVFSVIAVPANAVVKKEDSFSYTLGQLIDGSRTMPSIANFVTQVRAFNHMINVVVGVPIFNENNFNLALDETMTKFSTDVFMKSGVDFSEVYNQLPETNDVSEWITTTLRIDIVSLQTQMNDKAKALGEQGMAPLGFLVRWVSAWLGIIDKCTLSCQPVEGRDGLYTINADLVYRDGRTDTLYSGICIDTVNQMLTNIDGGPAVIGFYMDIDQAMTYTGVNTWQRKLGFTVVYDILVYLNRWALEYTTQRIKFEYDNMEWMCQVWKGRYLITNGGEVGFYNRPMGSKINFYNCASDEYLMDMTLDVYHCDDLLCHRDKTPHWWITGFAISDETYLPLTMTLVSTITMRDEEMLEAFTKALDGKKGIIDYDVDGLDVTIVW